MENANLPIEQYLPQVLEAVNNQHCLVLEAEPGAGKTTRVPSFLSEKLQGKVLVLEPRRLACRLIAEHLASQRGEKIGQSVGFQIRFERKISSDTQLTFITEGLFSRLLLGDPTLAGVECVILDEFHERNLHTDLSLVLIRKLQQTVRPDLKLVIMSATMDGVAIAKWLGGALHLQVPGRTFPVTVQYQQRPPKQSLENAVMESVKVAGGLHGKRDVLVFLSGAREIQSCLTVLKSSSLGKDWEVLPLYASLKASEQARVFKNTDLPKVILSTNVAETSLTLPNIGTVIDAGFHKQAGYGSWSGLPHLKLVRISKAAATQRAGRAGRTAAGNCIRLYSENEFYGFASYEVPEIARSELSQFLLEASHILARLQGKKSLNWEQLFSDLDWYTAPPVENLETAKTLLEGLGAWNQGGLTELGHKMLSVPLHPRLAAVFLRAQKEGFAEAGLLAATFLSEGMPVSTSRQADEVGGCDLLFQMQIFLQWNSGQEFERDSINRSFKVARAHAIKKLWVRMCKSFGLQATSNIQLPESPGLMGEILFAGFFDRVAKVQPKSKALLKRKEDFLPHGKSLLFAFCGGRGGSLAACSTVSRSELILALDVLEDPRIRKGASSSQITVASEMSESSLKIADHSLYTCGETVNWDDKKGKAVCIRQHLYGKLVLSEERLELDSEAAEEALVQSILKTFPQPFSDSEFYSQYERRLQILDSFQIEHNMPQFQGELLEIFLSDVCSGKRSSADIAKEKLSNWIPSQIDPYEYHQFDKMLPIGIKLAFGRKVAIHYSDHLQAVVSSRLQDFFYLAKHPTLLDGKLPLTLELLAPSGRPIQKTQDLPGFWKGSYHQVRSEMKRRYPKHDWPDPDSLPKYQN